MVRKFPNETKKTVTEIRVYFTNINVKIPTKLRKVEILAYLEQNHFLDPSAVLFLWPNLIRADINLLDGLIQARFGDLQQKIQAIVKQHAQNMHNWLLQSTGLTPKKGDYWRVEIQDEMPVQVTEIILKRQEIVQLATDEEILKKLVDLLNRYFENQPPISFPIEANESSSAAFLAQIRVQIEDIVDEAERILQEEDFVTLLIHDSGYLLDENYIARLKAMLEDLIKFFRAALTNELDPLPDALRWRSQGGYQWTENIKLVRKLIDLLETLREMEREAENSVQEYVSTTGKEILRLFEDVLGSYHVEPWEDIEPAEDHFDLYIHLYWRVIGLIGLTLARDAEKDRFQFQIDDLILIVLVHELAHYVTHRGRDLEELSWKTEKFLAAPPVIKESLAQFLTWRFCRAGYRDHYYGSDQWRSQKTFERLLQSQSPIYTTFVNKYRGLGVETFRALLIATRKELDEGWLSRFFLLFERYATSTTLRQWQATDGFYNMLLKPLSSPEPIPAPVTPRARRMIEAWLPEPLAFQEWNEVKIKFPQSGLRRPKQVVIAISNTEQRRKETQVLNLGGGTILIEVNTGGHYRTRLSNDEIIVEVPPEEEFEFVFQVYPLELGQHKLILTIFRYETEDEMPQVLCEMNLDPRVNHKGGSITSVTPEMIILEQFSQELPEIDEDIWKRLEIARIIPHNFPVVIGNLIEIQDHESLYIKVRKATERLLKYIHRQCVSPKETTSKLRDLTQELYDKKVLTPIQKHLVDTIRLAGNENAHDWIEEPSQLLIFVYPALLQLIIWFSGDLD